MAFKRQLWAYGSGIVKSSAESCALEQVCQVPLNLDCGL